MQRKKWVHCQIAFLKKYTADLLAKRYSIRLLVHKLKTCDFTSVLPQMDKEKLWISARKQPQGMKCQKNSAQREELFAQMKQNPWACTNIPSQNSELGT